MQLLILRHGHADPPDYHGPDDGRPLTPEGISQATRAGELAKTAGLLPDLVLTSPLTRARETAEAFCTAAGLATPLIQTWLASGMRCEDAIMELRAFEKFRRVMIVGHEPDLSGLMEFLLGATGGTIEVKKGALACLEVSPPRARGRLLYLVPPGLTGA